MKQYRFFLIVIICFFLGSCNEVSNPRTIENERSETMVNQKNQWSEEYEGYLIEWAPGMMENKDIVAQFDDPTKGFLLYWEAIKLELKENKENYDNNVSIIVVRSGIIGTTSLKLTVFFVNGTNKKIENIGLDMEIKNKETQETYSNFKNIAIPSNIIPNIPPHTLYGMTFEVDNTLEDLDGAIDTNLKQGNVDYYPTVYYDTIEE